MAENAYPGRILPSILPGTGILNQARRGGRETGRRKEEKTGRCKSESKRGRKGKKRDERKEEEKSWRYVKGGAGNKEKK